MAGYLRALSRQFSISAPRMAVRTNLAWPWKVLALLAFALVVAGMWWWGFDFGQLLGGFNRREVEHRIAALEADTAAAQREGAALRTQNSELQSELAMMRGAQTQFSKQQLEMLQENARLKDELAFFQQFFADTARTPGVAVQRLTVDGADGPVVRYSVLLVRGGTTTADFEGMLALQADLVASPDSGAAPMTLALPADAPETTAPLALKFKYYQRVEGTFAIPPAYAVRTLTARVYENGVASPRHTRTLTLP
jgi:hypothetical protein